MDPPPLPHRHLDPSNTNGRIVVTSTRSRCFHRALPKPSPLSSHCQPGHPTNPLTLRHWHPLHPHTALDPHPSTYVSPGIVSWENLIMSHKRTSTLCTKLASSEKKHRYFLFLFSSGKKVIMRIIWNIFECSFEGYNLWLNLWLWIVTYLHASHIVSVPSEPRPNPGFDDDWVEQ